MWSPFLFFYITSIYHGSSSIITEQWDLCRTGFIELPFGFHPCVYTEGLTGIFSGKFFIKLSKSLLSMFTKVLFSLHKNSGRNFSHVSASGKLWFEGDTKYAFILWTPHIFCHLCAGREKNSNFDPCDMRVLTCSLFTNLVPHLI